LDSATVTELYISVITWFHLVLFFTADDT